MWTDGHRRSSYVTYTYHFMNDQWKINTAGLETSAFEHPHTGVRIHENYKRLLSEFGLRTKKITLVTDGDSAMEKFGRESRILRQHCICHCVHLLLCTDLMNDSKTGGISTLLQKIRNINHALIFRHAELKQYDMESQQQKLLAAIEEIVEIEEILNQESRFYNSEENDNANIIDLEQELTFANIVMDSKFSGLSKMNVTRWNSIPKMGRSHLKYKVQESELMKNLPFIPIILNSYDFFALQNA